MEFLLLILLLIAGALVLAKRKNTTRNVPDEPQNPAQQELCRRMGEFMEEDCFALMIQPVVDFRTNAVCGGEVVSRLIHPERGMISPDEFLPAIDCAGLHPAFDRHIFQKCCAWLSSSPAEGACLEILSCNFSRRSLSEADFATQLTQIADRYHIPHHRLAIEITEQERETDVQQFHRNLNQLKSDGFRVFLDDYGSGVTSEKDLIRCPLDIVKIDRSILLAAETEQGKTAFRAVVAMAKELGEEVACEGIETEEQRRFAREAGCQYGQGYLFFRPASTEQVFDMMERRRNRPDAV